MANVVAWVFGLVVVVVALQLAWRAFTRIGGKEARDMVRRGAALVDVQPRAGFQRSRLARARNIPLDELEKRLAELGGHGRSVIVYGPAGRASASAARILRNAGFRSVHDLGTQERWSADA
jgi:rhodanese-related sulfurtransferase